MEVAVRVQVSIKVNTTPCTVHNRTVVLFIQPYPDVQLMLSLTGMVTVQVLDHFYSSFRLFKLK